MAYCRKENQLHNHSPENSPVKIFFHNANSFLAQRLTEFMIGDPRVSVAGLRFFPIFRGTIDQEFNESP
jgi:hypothetical protein